MMTPKQGGRGVEFGMGEVRQPVWATELMRDYHWRRAAQRVWRSHHRPTNGSTRGTNP